jgi:type IV pilus assembly protein PilY1
MKTLKIYLRAIVLMGLMIPISLTHAEDIDIYDASAGSLSNPNILIILDNSSNWSANNQGWPTDTSPPVPCGSACSKQGYYELKALRTLIQGLEANYADATGNVPINIGLMMFNASNATRAGAFVRSAVKPMTASNRTALIATLDNIITDFNTEGSNSVQYGAALFDAFKYFGGFTNPANATTDLAPTTLPTYSSIPVFGTQFWGSNDANGTDVDATAYSGSNYVPIAAASCGRNYVVFIGNGFPAKDDTGTNMAEVLSKLINPANPTTVAQNDIQNYTTTASTSTSASSCSIVTSSPGNSCVNQNTCETNRTTNPLYTSTSTSTSTSTTNESTGVITTVTTSPSTTYSCIKSTCNGNDKKIQGCSSTSITTTTNTPNGLPAQPSGNATGRYADEYTSFLYTTDVTNVVAGQQNVTTYAIDVYKNHQDADQSALMRNMASYGGGKYYAATDLSELSKAFDNILAEIQSVNSVFASSSLPVSVNTQGTYLNQVFVGMFRPDSASKPRWLGNLKQYQFKIFGSTLRLADFSATPIEAISASTGFITSCATSAWSTDTGSYWRYNSNSAGLCNAATKFSDAPDGATVEKGGAAQRLRGVTSSGTSTNYTTRALKTCDASDGCAGGLTDFNTANTTLTASALGVTSGSETNLINWVRGQDVDNENDTTAFPDPTGIEEMRPSVHGGVVHSQPAVIDYGGTTGVVSFYGADDGVFHAVNGNKTVTDGNEYWGFIAPESYSKLNRLKANTQLISYPTVEESLAPAPKDYFFDGSIGVFQRTSTNTVWIFPTMRRGGRAIYAFDVSNPASPVLKWRKGCFTNSTTDDANCTTGWSDIGQTWSKPQIAYLSGYVDGSNNPKPVLVFGGGYDTCEDDDSQTRCATTPRKGANIWFVDADTGAILRTYPTNYSVAGEVTLLTDFSGYATYAYAADTGGYIYRVNIGTYDGTTFGSAWTSNSAATNITIASLSEIGNARKFLFGPDVVVYSGFNAVMIGSGDREHPLVDSYACNNFSTTSGVQNQFFMLKDTPAAYPASAITPADLTDVTTGQIMAANASGWRFNLLDYTASSPGSRCEQTVNKSLTIGGVTYFGTNGPKSTSELSNSCGTNLGNARGYAVDFLTGAAVAQNGSRYTNYSYGGLPPSPVGGIVDIDGKKVPFCIGCTLDDANPSPLQGSPITINPAGPRQRVYWYMETD